MKPMKRTLTLLTAILLAAALMTGCTKLTEAKDPPPPPQTLRRRPGTACM